MKIKKNFFEPKNDRLFPCRSFTKLRCQAARFLRITTGNACNPLQNSLAANDQSFHARELGFEHHLATTDAAAAATNAHLVGCDAVDAGEAPHTSADLHVLVRRVHLVDARVQVRSDPPHRLAAQYHARAAHAVIVLAAEAEPAAFLRASFLLQLISVVCCTNLSSARARVQSGRSLSNLKIGAALRVVRR